MTIIFIYKKDFSHTTLCFVAMEFMVFITLLLLLILVPILFLFRYKKHSDRLPPGSLGLPVIGQSLGLLKALKADRVDKWFQERITNHGPVWKANLFGYPTVVLHGPAANKFIYTCDGNLLTNTQPPSISRILGSKNIIELSGNDHKRVRAALVSFLKLEVLKQYVGKVDEEVQHHLLTHWHGKHEVQVQPLIKILTFNIICSLLFGIERGPEREKMLPLFQDMIEGVLSIPINLPFTQYSRGLVARKKLVPMLLHLIQEKREALQDQNQPSDPHKDLITLLLSIRDDDSSKMMSEEEIIDNIIVVMIAGYDTTSVLLTFLVRLLANDRSIYSTIVREQKEIASSKAFKEALTWEDLTKMKFTWRVATEMMRINPPVTLSFRRAKQDIEYGGFIIPKGWQVLLSASMTHMDDSIFQNPTMFDPTRYEKHTPPPPFSYVAFGAGPRMCPGIELAKMETLVMMHRLVTSFTWELLNKDELFIRVPMPEFDQGLLVQVKPLNKTMEA
ncbi:putative abieta-7,13-dien-18-ol hydroxylase [Helianthus anomalus]